MQNKIFWATCLLSACINNLPTFAQIDPKAFGYYEDAFRFSQLTTLQGSSRIQAIGGAQTAIGGDISNITGNPAGLGFFGKTTASVGFGAGNVSAKTDYFTQRENPNAMFNANRGLGSLNHLGAVIALKPNEESTGIWKGGSFGFSIVRTNNFQGLTAFQGNNNRNSKVDWLVHRAWNITEAQFQNRIDFNDATTNYLRAAYDALLFSAPTNPSSSFRYFNYFRGFDEQIAGTLKQEGNYNTRGGQNQWNFAFGGNLADKFYFGFSAGMTTLRYNKYDTYKETADVPNAVLSNFTEFDSLQVKGTGINFSVGIIARPVDFVRIGASFTAPTVLGIQETTITTFSSSTSARSGGVLEDFKFSSPKGSYTYEIRTPMRASGGLAFFIKKYGFVTAEVEYVSYNTMNLKDYDDATLFNADNTTIQNLYKSVLNIKGGAELRLDKFYIRGGYAYMPNPVKPVDFIDRKITHITGGLGYSTEGNTFDLSFVNTTFQSGGSPYDTNWDFGTANTYGTYLNSMGISQQTVGNAPYRETKHNIIQATLTYTKKF